MPRRLTFIPRPQSGRAARIHQPNAAGLSRHSEKVKTVAKLTQARYGTIRNVASLCRRQNAKRVPVMSSHRTTLSARDSAPWCQTQKT